MTDDKTVSHTTRLCGAHEFGPDLLRYLGLPPDNCRRAKILLEADQPVTVIAEYYVQENGKITDNTRLKHYKFTPTLREKRNITINIDSSIGDALRNLHVRLTCLAYGISYPEAVRRLEWQKHPLYQWAQRKIGAIK